MTVVHTYFYIVVYTQRGCRTLKNLLSLIYITNLNTINTSITTMFVSYFQLSLPPTHSNTPVSLEAFSKFRKTTVNFVTPVCPSSVRPHGTTHFPLGDFS